MELDATTIRLLGLGVVPLPPATKALSSKQAPLAICKALAAEMSQLLPKAPQAMSRSSSQLGHSVQHPPTHAWGEAYGHGGSPWPTAISLYGAHKESTVHASGLGCAKLCSPLTVELHSHTGGHVSKTKAQCMSLGLANKLVTQYVSKTLREIK